MGGKNIGSYPYEMRFITRNKRRLASINITIESGSTLSDKVILGIFDQRGRIYKHFNTRMEGQIIGDMSNLTFEGS